MGDATDDIYGRPSDSLGPRQVSSRRNPLTLRRFRVSDWVVVHSCGFLPIGEEVIRCEQSPQPEMRNIRYPWISVLGPEPSTLAGSVPAQSFSACERRYAFWEPYQVEIRRGLHLADERPMGISTRVT